MRTLSHPFTVVTYEATPSTAELMEHVGTCGNSYEAAQLIQDQAEADYAALQCAADESDLARELAIQADAAEMENDRLNNDLDTAEQELLNVIDRYGILTANDLIQRVADRVVARHFDNIPAPRPITAKVRKVNWQAFGVDPDHKPAA